MNLKSDLTLYYLQETQFIYNNIYRLKIKEVGKDTSCKRSKESGIGYVNIRLNRL